MKFSVQLRVNLVPEWREKYMAYKYLKKQIKKIEPLAGDPPQVELLFNDREAMDLGMMESGEDGLNEITATPLVTTVLKGDTSEAGFFAALDAELMKGHMFYLQQERECEERLQLITDQIPQMREELMRCQKKKKKPNYQLAASLGFKEDPAAKKTEIKMATFDLIHRLDLLKNYSALQTTGFYKITKKHDKKRGWKVSEQYHSAVERASFYQPPRLDELMQQAQDLFINEFAGGDRKKGMKVLRPPARTPLGDVFFIGLYSGISLPMILLLTIMFLENGPAISNDPTFVNSWPLYRLLTMLCVHILGFAFNIVVWKKYRLNYRFIFGFNQRKKGGIVGSSTLVRIAMGLLWCLLFSFTLHTWLVTLRLEEDYQQQQAAAAAAAVEAATSAGGRLLLQVADSVEATAAASASSAAAAATSPPPAAAATSAAAAAVAAVAAVPRILRSVSAEGVEVETTLGDINPVVPPFVLAVFFTTVFICPFRVNHSSVRYRMWRLFWDVLRAPFARVGFPEAFLADQMASQTRGLGDLGFLLCYYFSGSFLTHSEDDPRCGMADRDLRLIVAYLPYYIRFMQCCRRYYETKHAFPHLANAFKYFCALMVTMSSQVDVTALWVFWAVVATGVAYGWDLVMDWGLLRQRDPKKKNFLLRDVLMYEDAWKYRLAMVSNFFLRVLWVFTISDSFSAVREDMLVLVLGCLEVGRRVQWNLFRVESEQLLNMHQFRVTRDVPLPFDVMEEEDDDEDSVETKKDMMRFRIASSGAPPRLGAGEGSGSGGDSSDDDFSYTEKTVVLSPSQSNAASPQLGAGEGTSGRGGSSDEASSPHTTEKAVVVVSPPESNAAPPPHLEAGEGSGNWDSSDEDYSPTEKTHI